MDCINSHAEEHTVNPILIILMVSVLEFGLRDPGLKSRSFHNNLNLGGLDTVFPKDSL